MTCLSAEDRRNLLAWYDDHRRDLPWRNSKDPYAVWVSEIMLQQTQVATVEPYWRRWMERFPTISDLASADEDDALSYWQGLGYYRRCRLLIQGAKQVHHSGLPTTAEEWERVPGVGRYTAGAISSIAQGVIAAVVDGNVERVYARSNCDGSSGTKLTSAAWAWAEATVDGNRPGDWNQALMELGATVCVPSQPTCFSCPLRSSCSAYRAGSIGSFPAKKPGKEIVELRQEVWIPCYNGHFGVRRIETGRWWRGMWEFPRADASEIDQLMLLIGDVRRQALGVIRHSVTYHRIALSVFRVVLSEPLPGLIWKTPGELSETALPSPQRRAYELLQRWESEHVGLTK